MITIGKIFIKLDRLHSTLREKVDKETQLIAIAGFENGLCTKYLVNKDLLDLIYNSSKIGFNQPPEIISIGFLGTNEDWYNYLKNGLDKLDDIFEFQDLEMLTENTYQKFLNTNSKLTKLCQ